MTRFSAMTRRRNPILWIMVLVWIAALAAQSMPIRQCTGPCSNPARPVTASCCASTQAARDAEATCCRPCCALGDEGEADLSKDQAEEDTAADDTLRVPDCGGLATADGSCCVLVMLELEPAPVETDATPSVPAPVWCAPAPRAEFAFHDATTPCRRLDRGPPRVDWRTARRACTVLLI